MSHISRRHVLGFAACLILAGRKTAWANAPARTLSFYSLHTGEKITATYAENGVYVPDALTALNQFLRDHRTGDVHTMDVGLLDQLHTLQTLMDSKAPYHLISAYRAPVTNQALHTHSDGVAKKSLHMEGRAIDICLPGKDLAALHKAALAMKAGGVGYYPTSNFIHLDTGRVRHWG